jgi:threonylcarbamoyladenosine tRNA methylthiotransferase MtaB
MRVHLKALGCRLNEAELERWAHRFNAQGHRLVNDAASADLVVLNSCAVTGEAVRKSRQALGRLHRANPRAKLIATGCFATLEPERAAEQLGVDLVVSNADKDRLPEIAVQALDITSMPAAATQPGAAPLFARERSRAFVKIQDGCRYRCTFCIVTLARGAERSRPVGEIIDEINRLVDDGVREAVLTGVHVGGYGKDLDTDLQGLIASILAGTDLPRLRLASVEPWDLPGDFFSLFENRRLMPHMHLPLQSGSDTVLRRMARRCKRADFERLVQTARAAVPDFNVTTDIIVGFPGETEREWCETLEFVERIGFGHLHIFTYSPRAGTKAASLPDPITPELQRRRSRELHMLGARLKRAALQRLVGRELEVLWESVVDDQHRWGPARLSGYTPSYLRASILTTNPAPRLRRIERVRLTGLAAEASGLEAVTLPSQPA